MMRGRRAHVNRLRDGNEVAPNGSPIDRLEVAVMSVIKARHSAFRKSGVHWWTVKERKLRHGICKLVVLRGCVIDGRDGREVVLR